MAFARRILNFKFELGDGDFGNGGANAVDLTGLRASANISRAGGNSLSLADVRIWGMPLETMNKLTVLNVYATPERRNNKITIMAGDEESGVAVAFVGTIQEAWADGTDTAEMVFQVTASSGLFESSKAIAPTSYRGSVDVSTVVSGIAAQMGLTMENSGVSAKIDSPYLPGSVGAQLRSIAAAAHINYLVDSEKQVLAIWPKGKTRDGEAIVISAKTGLAGYPAFTQAGVRLRTLYDPSLVFGRQVSVESQLGPANGTWVIANVSHNLDAEMPGGQWFTEVECTLFGHELPVLG